MHPGDLQSKGAGLFLSVLYNGKSGTAGLIKGDITGSIVRSSFIYKCAGVRFIFLSAFRTELGQSVGDNLSLGICSDLEVIVYLRRKESLISSKLWKKSI